ncbi:MAG: nuclear transport factor 2 family protein [Novosphingobium sp.]
MADLQSISDRLDIRELADRYTVGITCRDWELVTGCFHPDARWRASVGFDFQGRDALVGGIRAIVEASRFQLQMHHAISIDSLRAGCDISDPP